MAVARAHFILFVADQARSAAFYGQALAITPRLDVPGMTEFDLPGGAILGLMPEAGIHRLIGIEAGGDRPRAEVYLVVDDPAAHLARALAAGADALSPLQPRGWGDEAGYVRDPDGHLLAFARPAS